MKVNFDDLVESGLVKKKTYPNGLSIYKYARKVFYDNLWNQDERLLMSRGIVLDENNNVIVRPFDKIFNFKENGVTIEDDRICLAYPKINGFLGCVTNTDKYGVIYSTTGSLDSDFVDLIKKHIPEDVAKDFKKNVTYMFEICDKSDPHIVNENIGAHILAVRDVDSGKVFRIYDKYSPLYLHFFNESADWTFHVGGCQVVCFRDLLECAKASTKEGWIVETVSGSKVELKIKTNHYLVKKFLLRVKSNDKIDKLFTSKNYKLIPWIEEEFYDLCQHLQLNYTSDQWYSFDQEERRTILDKFFGELDD